MLERVENNTPTVVFGASFDAGQEATRVRVELDGKLVSERIDGRSLPVDPGAHQARLVASGGEARVLSVVVEEGRKNVLVTADFRTPKPTGAERGATASKPKIPAATWALGAIGVAALGSWAYFGLNGYERQRDMEKTCAPHCSQDQADRMRRSYLIADVSLLVGLASLGAATAFAFARTERPTSAHGVGPRLRIAAQVFERGSGALISATYGAQLFGRGSGAAVSTIDGAR
jgi:hypothetical protein